MIQGHQKTEIIKNLFMLMDAGRVPTQALEDIRDAYPSEDVSYHINEAILFIQSGNKLADSLNRSGIINSMDKKRIEAILGSHDPCGMFIKYQHLFEET